MSNFSYSLYHYTQTHLLWIVTLLALFYPGQDNFPKLTANAKFNDSLLLIENLTPYPHNDGTPAPSHTAYAVIVQDATNRSILYEKNSDVAMLPASTTKLMTALVALELYPDLETLLPVTVEDHTLGQTMDLVAGEVISVYNLLAGLLIHSANDAALTLANNASGGYDGFVRLMNQKATELGLTGTHYQNPSGLEQYNHHTTARDLAVLIAEVARHSIITELMLKSSLIVTDSTGKISHSLKTTDRLLGVVPGLIAAKTGFTQNAGECLATYVEQDGKSIVTVVLKSQDRFGETKRFINWAFNNHSWVIPPELY